MTSMVNPFLSLYGNQQQVPENLKNISTYKGTPQQEQQQMLANQAAGRQTMGTSMPYQQQFNPMMQQIRNPSAANFNPYQQLGKPTLFGTTMQNPIMQAPWFQQIKRPPLMPGQYGYGNGIV